MEIIITTRTKIGVTIHTFNANVNAVYYFA